MKTEKQEAIDKVYDIIRQNNPVKPVGLSLVHDYINTHHQIIKLKTIGGIDWVVDTLSTTVDLIGNVEALYQSLQEDDKGVDFNMIESIGVPWGAIELTWRINEIMRAITCIMERDSESEKTLLKMGIEIDPY